MTEYRSATDFEMHLKIIYEQIAISRLKGEDFICK
jgi:hypothetical protein